MKKKIRADRDDDEEEESKSESSGWSSVQSTASSPASYNFEEVDFSKFSAFMASKFGLKVFQTGYEIMLKYRGERFTSDLDLTSLVKGLIPNEKEAAEFVSLCSTYMILENYSKQIAARR